MADQSSFWLDGLKEALGIYYQVTKKSWPDAICYGKNKEEADWSAPNVLLSLRDYLTLWLFLAIYSARSISNIKGVKGCLNQELNRNTTLNVLKIWHDCKSIPNLWRLFEESRHALFFKILNSRNSRCLKTCKNACNVGWSLSDRTALETFPLAS